MQVRFKEQAAVEVGVDPAQAAQAVLVAVAQEDLNLQQLLVVVEQQILAVAVVEKETAHLVVELVVAEL